jgi:hypothetical protein
MTNYSIVNNLSLRAGKTALAIGFSSYLLVDNFLNIPLRWFETIREENTTPLWSFLMRWKPEQTNIILNL